MRTILQTSTGSNSLGRLVLIYVTILGVIHVQALDQCEQPDRRSCTGMTPKATKDEGLGVYYENPCHGPGCGFFYPYCRLCWIDSKAPGKLDRPECPSCVTKHFQKANSSDSLCHKPSGRSCTGMTPKTTKDQGLGVYYQKHCHGPGCGFFKSYCRLCWIDPKAPGRMDRPECPPCVSEVLNKQ